VGELDGATEALQPIQSFIAIEQLGRWTVVISAKTPRSEAISKLWPLELIKLVQRTTKNVEHQSVLYR